MHLNDRDGRSQLYNAKDLRTSKTAAETKLAGSVTSHEASSCTSLRLVGTAVAFLVLDMPDALGSPSK